MLVLVGLGAGVVGGGLGIGGGIVMVPVLVAIGFDRHRSHATSLAAIVLISAAAVTSSGRPAASRPAPAWPRRCPVS